MKILVDESCPRKLRNDFGDEHEVWTVRDKKWLGKKNGELLALMIADKFELFVTVDQNLSYQQNIQSLPITIIVLCGSDTLRQTLRLLLPKMFAKLTEEPSKKFIEIT